jgi:hypothetical protein
MCSRCDDIDNKISHYRRLSEHIDDLKMQEAAAALIASLEAEKLTLHPEEE